MMNDQIEAMRQAAERASSNDEGLGYYRPWAIRTNEKGYPQTILREGDVVLVAECFEGPEHPPVFAEHIVTSHPRAVLDLIEYVRELEGRLVS